MQRGSMTLNLLYYNTNHDIYRITPAQPFESSNKISQNYEQTLLLSNEDSNAAGDPSHQTDLQQPTENRSAAPLKRKAEDSSSDLDGCSDSKKAKTGSDPAPYHESLLPAPSEPFSLFCKEDFRDHFCRCASCYLNLRKQPQLLEEEESYEPPLSESGEEAGQSVGTGSLLDRGEAALSNVDRVRAIGKLPNCLPFPMLVYYKKAYQDLIYHRGRHGLQPPQGQSQNIPAAVCRKWPGGWSRGYQGLF